VVNISTKRKVKLDRAKDGSVNQATGKYGRLRIHIGDWIFKRYYYGRETCFIGFTKSYEKEGVCDAYVVAVYQPRLIPMRASTINRRG